MKNKYNKTYRKKRYESKINKDDITVDELIELCVQKGLIEKTEYGYYFKKEFFETLDIYNVF
ncbi:MAG: hypothetical protein QXS02_03280 [Candidatus Thermoplasmatota archaeon]